MKKYGMATWTELTEGQWGVGTYKGNSDNYAYDQFGNVVFKIEVPSDDYIDDAHDLAVSICKAHNAAIKYAKENNIVVAP